MPRAEDTSEPGYTPRFRPDSVTIITDSRVQFVSVQWLGRLASPNKAKAALHSAVKDIELGPLYEVLGSTAQ